MGSLGWLLHREGGRRALCCFPCLCCALPAGSPPLPLERASRCARTDPRKDRVRGPGDTAVSSNQPGLQPPPPPIPCLGLRRATLTSFIPTVHASLGELTRLWSRTRWEQSMDMGTSGLLKKPWWTLPENFDAPMVFHMEEDQEELIFGHSDTYLRCIEMNSRTLIQLESWFTATGQTRVTVVGPHRARQWLLHMFCCMGSRDSYCHARGLEMLERVRSQPLTNDDLVTSISVPPYTGDLSLAPRISGTVCLSVPQPSPYQVIGCSGFHLSSLYP
ncbi:KH homology domain-containing protein 1 isoform X1 [Sapajus apella]|uniref:KH homology domain-containing protein 1 isoform X1 n=2 Tax=Sapajus apella TaxID=9515 RepID=A0A6J3HIG6_SAPAP|nr:KH homology domain-containing protein 1 isoform X1 [Sapajus apella]